MFRSRPKLGPSRRIAAYYLFFCLLAVCWLAGWVVVTSHALLVNRSANGCLMRLGKAAAAIEMHVARQGSKGLEQPLSDLAAQCHAAHCSVVGYDGNVIAHTVAKLVGTAADEPAGDRAHWGDVTSVAYVDAEQRALLEYRAPLGTAKRRIGELRVAVEKPSMWATIADIAYLAPIGLLTPLLLVGVGAFVLSRITRPAAEVQLQLGEIARLPMGADVAIEPLRARDAVSLGWNRLADQLEALARRPAQGELIDILELAAQHRDKAQFEEVLQRLSDGIAVTNAEGRIAFANQAVAALLGIDEAVDGLVGESIEHKLSAAATTPLGSEMISPAAKQRTTTCELVQKSAGCERVLRVSRLPLGGDARSHVWSLRDVTQQKLTEQTRDRFIDTATHELRTPLSNIKAYAETLATTEYIDIELQKEFCNIINSEVTRLARFIDDLLSISSMEVGSLMIDRQKVETQRMFAEVLSKVEPQMQQKSIAFDTALPPKMPELTLDKDKIIAVLVNVLGNAAKYTPEGGSIQLKVVVEKGALRASVKDSGVGIAPEELPRVFDKFFRSDDPRVRAETGSGLGLSLAQEVVRMHGGEITVESVLNQGSVFTISLPLS